MNESIQVKSSAGSGAAATVKAATQAKASAGDNQDAAAEPSEFTSVFSNYLQSEPAANDKKASDGMAEILAVLFPDGLPEDGKELPQQGDDAVLWQAYAQFLPAENTLANKDGVAIQAQGISLLDPKAKTPADATLLTPGFFPLSGLNADEKITALTEGGETKNLIARLAALQVEPAKKDAVLFNLGEQLTPQHTSNSTFSTSLSALGGTAATTATQNVVTTQSQMAPLNLAHSGWESNLASRLQMLIGQHSQQADIRLDPPDLGSLDVKIKIVNDIATVSFSSPHHHVRDALESAVPRLREMFADSGLSLGDVNVRQESFAQQQNPSGEQGPSSNSFASFTPEDERHDIARKIVSNNLLDTYA